MRRSIVIVMDSAGIGELPDAKAYGDEGSNTIGNISAKISSLTLPNLIKLGLSNIRGAEVLHPFKPDVMGCYGRMAEKSAGKDTTTGHWELAGIILDKPFPTFPQGFPAEVVESFEKRINARTLGNYAVSGTKIIQELGQQHVKTGYPIIYTSADSVFQIAAHEAVIPPDKLYEMCRVAREILKDDYAVGRVIARPFAGENGNYARTDRRRDFSLKPAGRTFLDCALDKGLEVKAVGKIEDIFAGKGISEAVHTHGNSDGIDRTLEFIKQEFEGIIFTNLVDFDMLYGHRNDAAGYARALEAFDERVPELLAALKQDDILFITADHGCDPTTPSTDHSREYVPVLVAGKNVKKGVDIGTRESFSDLAATISSYLGTDLPVFGKSFLESIIKL